MRQRSGRAWNGSDHRCTPLKTLRSISEEWRSGTPARTTIANARWKKTNKNERKPTRRVATPVVYRHTTIRCDFSFCLVLECAVVLRATTHSTDSCRTFRAEMMRSSPHRCTLSWLIALPEKDLLPHHIVCPLSGLLPHGTTVCACRSDQASRPVTPL